ncbi:MULTISPECIES: DUF2911 domain-containing protein [Adhaeribacter]|uniref:DUF2911 domain-containing protein n=2 Tax=Adhaeribacter TaxID=299566 RepID=A0A512B5S0_9BACT|nr:MULTISPECIES: DUF2911 domain-containing protein [Adhaeribacter]KAA5542036.1 DUF2911 domain-containing protein [Adhaeribacter rhizoryzae]GEO07308.1 hypothetical protein AAE02nite_49720 [Adhaeribacter aerolatus]
MSLKFTHYFALVAISFSFTFCNQKPETTQKQEIEKPTAAPTTANPEDAVTIAEQPEPDTLKGSLKAVATGQIGSVNVVINYHSPAVRKRVVWGGLVPYDQVWVTGAHSATTIETDGPIQIGGQAIPAGKYAFFTIPGEKEWTVILNKNWEQHLADEYSAKEDILRLPVQVEKTDKPQERLRYVVKAAGENKGTIEMHWERLRIPVPVAL